MKTLKDLIDEYTQVFEEMAADQAPCGGEFDFRDLVEDLATKVWNSALIAVMEKTAACCKEQGLGELTVELPLDEKSRKFVLEYLGDESTQKER